MEPRDRLTPEAIQIATDAMRAHVAKHPEIGLRLKARGHTIETFARMQCELSVDVLEAISPWNPTDAFEVLLGIGAAYGFQLGIARDAVVKTFTDVLDVYISEESATAQAIGSKLVEQTAMAGHTREAALEARGAHVCDGCTDNATLVCRCARCQAGAISDVMIEGGLRRVPARSCGIHRVIVGDSHFRTLRRAAEWHSAGEKE